MNDTYVVLRSFPSEPGYGVREGGMYNTWQPRNVVLSTASASELPTLRQDPNVEAFAPSLPMRLIQPVSKQSIGEGGVDHGMSWGIQAVGAHECRFDGAGIVVAVLDTGIATDHPAFDGVTFLEKDFSSRAADDPRDHDGHGTHCAGTIFGRTVQNTRIGVATGVTRALNGKVIGASGGSSEGIANAILWAVEQGAHVISMSLGMDFPGYVKSLISGGIPEGAAVSMALEGYRQNVLLFERLATLLRARKQPCLMVAAAGNESGRDRTPAFRIATSPPAVSEGIISVAALGRAGDDLHIATFSNTGALVSAPGVDIPSAAHTGGLTLMSGTSMAAPHVAGIAALWAQKLQTEGLLTPAFLQGKLLSSARRERLRGGAHPDDVGAGLIMAPPV